MRQVQEFSLNSQFIAAVAILGGKEFFDIAGRSAEGLIVVTSVQTFTDSSDQSVRNFVNRYESKYKENLNVQQLYAARSYDALKIVAATIDKCDVNTECVKEELYKIKDYKGVSGAITFDRNGDISSTFYLQVVKNGQFVDLQK